MRTLATNWEAEVADVRSDNLELHSLLRGAQAQQSQAEERAHAAEQKAKEADELKATLDAKVARSPSRRTSSCKSVPLAKGPRTAPAGAGRSCRRPVGARAGAYRSRGGAEAAGGAECRVLETRGRTGGPQHHECKPGAVPRRPAAGG
jgi:regulator of protease activity HflC (stomatin/prohibitin superfamily)